MADIRKLEEQVTVLTAKFQALKSKVLASKSEHGRWWIGNDTSYDELISKVRDCITTKPRTLAELADLIGASKQRLSNAIVRLQVTGVQVKNLGDRYRAIWSIPRQAKKR